jgi:uncharacterized membrane protein YhhN
VKTALYLVPVLVVAAALLIRAELLKIRRQSYIFKPLSTLLVIAALLLAFWEPTQEPIYTIGVLIGLLFSLGGDIALLFQDNPKAFRLGLVFFLLAHIAYTVVFIILGHFTAWDILSGAVLLAAAWGFYQLLKPNLGSMKIPVIVYIVIISLMVNRAIAIFSSPEFSNSQAWLVAVGAGLFYISDVILAANRFWKPWKYQRISLAFYYAGQMLISLAASYFA